MKTVKIILLIIIGTYFYISSDIIIAETLYYPPIESYTDGDGYFRYTIIDVSHSQLNSIYIPVSNGNLFYDISCPENWSYNLNNQQLDFYSIDSSNFVQSGDIFELYAPKSEWEYAVIFPFDFYAGTYVPILMIIPYYESIITPVNIDIRPSEYPNMLNVKSKGKFSVAILGTDDFKVFNIDPASIRLAGVAPIRSSYEDVTSPSTERPDGYLDLTLKFDTQEIISALAEGFEELNDGDEFELTLTGVLDDDTQIEGKDCIAIISKEKSNK